jgi:hypothetical protein
MQVKIIVLLLVSGLIFSACEKAELAMESTLQEPLTGYWVNMQVVDTLLSFTRADKLVENDYGFAFLPEGKFLERKNSGWCATPPIAYADFQGTWSYTDSVITISTGYWGGTATYHWQLISADDKYLTIQIISDEYLPEN